MSKKVYVFLWCVCLFTSIVCLYGFLSETKQYQQAEQLYAYKTSNQPSKASKTSLNHVETVERGDASEEINWKEMENRFPDIVGWISGEDLDYPIVQGIDNQYYLDHLADRTPNRIGSIFLDASAPSDFSGEVSIIYGHHVRDNQMFSGLKQYQKQEYYEAHPVMSIGTPTNSFQMELIGAYLVNGSTDQYPTDFASPQEMQQYLEEVREKSYFKSDVTVKSDEKLVILSTCSYEFDNARLAVVGVLRSA